jgi:hypothetical protein
MKAQHDASKSEVINTMATKMDQQSSALPHAYFIKHLMYMTKKPPQKYSENQEKLKPWIRRLKNNTGCTYQNRHQI